MAEARHGSAMRTYQLLLVLAFGWLIGRLPALLDDSRNERADLMAAAGLSQPTPPAAADGGHRLASEVDMARLASEIAVRVSGETVARLIEAGWGPPLPEAGRTGRAPPAPPAYAGWRLPPGELATGGASSALMAGGQPGAAASGADSGTESALVNSEQVAEPRAASAHALAESGYRALKHGERAEAATLLAAALEADPGAANADNWRADLRNLQRHWALSFYTVAREGAGDPLAASPALGGGQSGAMLAYRMNPLAERPISFFGRITAASAARGGIDRETAEGALGVRVEPVKTLPIAVDIERRFAFGTMSRNAWSARLSGGTSANVRMGGVPLQVDGWGEAGIVGFHKHPDLYAGGQVRGGADVAQLGRMGVNLGLGSWAAVQRGWGVTASRVDLGPSARVRLAPWSAYAQIDYRARVTGNALPGSGPVVTVAADF